MIGVELVGAGAAISLVGAMVAFQRPKQLAKPNYRGVILPLVLGLVVISAAALAILVVALERAARSDRVVITHRVALVGLAIAVVFTAGLVDDLSHGGPRGLRGHLEAHEGCNTSWWKTRSSIAITTRERDAGAVARMPALSEPTSIHEPRTVVPSLTGKTWGSHMGRHAGRAGRRTNGGTPGKEGGGASAPGGADRCEESR